MKSTVFATVLFLLSAACSEAFVANSNQKLALTSTKTPVQPLQGFLGDKERESLTRDSEPEEFFAT